MLIADARSIAFLRELYRGVDEEIGGHGPTCGNCRRCCDFAASGLNLFVTNVELAYFLAGVKRVPGPIAGRCPFLDEARGCTVREFRPLGCRTFFCKAPAGYDPQAIYEAALSRIKGFIRENDLPYSYREWLECLAEAVAKGT